MPNFSKNSWHYKLYQFMWYRTAWEYDLIKGEGVESDKVPKNLCPYFWKIVLGLVLFPALFFGATGLLVSKLDSTSPREPALGITAIAIGFFSWVALFIIFCMLGAIWLPYFLQSIGVGFWTVLLLIGVTYGTRKLFYFIRNKFSTPKKYKKPKDGLIKSMWKSFYNKNCPKINWN